MCLILITFHICHPQILPPLSQTNISFFDCYHCFSLSCFLLKRKKDQSFEEKKRQRKLKKKMPKKTPILARHTHISYILALYQRFFPPVCPYFSGNQL